MPIQYAEDMAEIFLFPYFLTSERDTIRGLQIRAGVERIYMCIYIYVYIYIYIYIYLFKVRKVRKEAKYTSLCSTHVFTPVAIETSGVFGPESLSFIRELGWQIVHVTAEVNSTNYLMQRLTVAVQRGNSAAVLGTTGLLLKYIFLRIKISIYMTKEIKK